MLGNELTQGDSVMVKYGTEWIAALIMKVGIANPTQKNGQQNVTADVVVLQVTMPLAGVPGQPQPFIAKLDTKNVKQQIVDLL